MGWLLFIYRVPSEPSRNRVTIWRELKRLGGFYLQQSVCILPNYAPLEGALVALGTRIREWGGQSHLLSLTSLNEEEEKKIIEGFQKARDKDYEEIIEQCDHLFEELARETEQQNFSSSEVEENEEDLERLKRWFHRVQDRDWFGALGGEAAKKRLAEAEVALEVFSQKVYELENFS
ncbi:MAG: hypothetical protein HY664_04195 [Chloroflexi bacterium]|nr:hypothetical protein [Chloroflexota bacterium]